MTTASLFASGRYSLAWVKDFYTQAGIWWGRDPQEEGVHEARVQTLQRLCGPGLKRVLDLGAGPGATSAALAQTLRCYTPADLLLLLEGTGLALRRIEVDGQALAFETAAITTSGPLLDAWSYLAQLTAAD
jgi:hypothetical protein